MPGRSPTPAPTCWSPARRSSRAATIAAAIAALRTRRGREPDVVAARARASSPLAVAARRRPGRAGPATTPTARSSASRPTAAIFAFEEFGVQDGSGFAYANVYVIDVASGRLGQRHADPRHARERGRDARERARGGPAARRAVADPLRHRARRPCRGEQSVERGSPPIRYAVRFLSDLYRQLAATASGRCRLIPVPLPEPMGCQSSGRSTASASSSPTRPARRGRSTTRPPSPPRAAARWTTRSPTS